jgi:peptide-N4-(N-acetyl-beta-glucosaminyl)asparagine amidase
LKSSALKLIPIDRLKLAAINNLRKFQKLIKEKQITETEPNLDDLVLEELASWFKNEFFTWVNNMECKICSNDQTRPNGTRMVNGVRVEQYYCEKCRVITEFPRFNDIEKLLITRKGRCGEFANCFTFLCRALGYDARYIFSTSDHVWTEVYNHSKKRFIHVDPSDNVFDSPLMYECGWKKKLEYVIAFSYDDIQDVTWRYSNQHDQLLERRRMCSEKDLLAAINTIRIKRQSEISPARKKFLTMRTLAELAELLIIREPTEDEKRGRSSGSIAWRLARGETNTASNNNYVFKLMQSEMDSKQFNLRYSCAKNIYERYIGSSVIEVTKDWKDFEYQSQNVFRKVEHDHKMAYLARSEDSEKGMLQWKFDFSNCTIKSINLNFSTQTFNTGKLVINFLDSTDRIVESKDDLIGCSKFSIVVHLSGGSGDCAWQHAQVFRQKLNSDDFPFQLSIKFN